jgi:hypothetical protein
MIVDIRLSTPVDLPSSPANCGDKVATMAKATSKKKAKATSPNNHRIERQSGPPDTLPGPDTATPSPGPDTAAPSSGPDTANNPAGPATVDKATNSAEKPASKKRQRSSSDSVTGPIKKKGKHSKKLGKFFFPAQRLVWYEHTMVDKHPSLPFVTERIPKISFYKS